MRRYVKVGTDVARPALKDVSGYALERRKHIEPEVFVTAWQLADSIQACADKLGIPKRNAAQRAAYFRKLGVSLKKFPAFRFGPGNGAGRAKLDIKNLNAIAGRLSPDAGIGCG